MVYYNSPEDIGGFQFLVDGAMVDSAFGGMAETPKLAIKIMKLQ